jgi:hypothetical protein
MGANPGYGGGGMNPGMGGMNPGMGGMNPGMGGMNPGMGGGMGGGMGMGGMGMQPQPGNYGVSGAAAMDLARLKQECQPKLMSEIQNIGRQVGQEIQDQKNSLVNMSKRRFELGTSLNTFTALTVLLNVVLVCSCRVATDRQCNP